MQQGATFGSRHHAKGLFISKPDCRSHQIDGHEVSGIRGSVLAPKLVVCIEERHRITRFRVLNDLYLKEQRPDI
jgi:hypothetical protein